MILQFVFAAAYATAIGAENAIVTLRSSEVTLGEALSKLYESNPDYVEVLQKSGLFTDGELVAMFISDSNFLTTDSTLVDGNQIKVLSRIIGG